MSNTYALVKVVLDELYKSAREKYETRVDGEIEKGIKYLAKKYRGLAVPAGALDYADPAVRFAYVYKYVGAHSSYVIQVLESLRTKLGKRVLPSESIVSCLGGGPGTDIIAILLYLDQISKVDNVSEVTFFLVDGEPAWENDWAEIERALEVNVSFEAMFYELNVASPAPAKVDSALWDADLFVMSYFVSEIWRQNPGKVSEFWAKLFSEAQDGALFLYIDNGSAAFNNYFDGICETYGLEVILKVTNARYLPRSADRCEVLSDYIEKFSENPKVQTSSLSCRVLRKPVENA